MKEKIGLALVILAVFSLAAAACSASPSPAAKPTVAAITPIAPSPTTSSAAKPTAAASPAAELGESQAAKPPAPADWKAEWDKTVAAAKQEGKVVMVHGPGDLYRVAVTAFQKSFPEIQVESSGISAIFPPQLVTERGSGQYGWDVYISGWNTPLAIMRQGHFDPIGPALILPEVLDDSKWRNGFADGWVDNERKFEYQFSARVTLLGYVNRDIVPESEFSKADQLLDPKWKGKIAILDPRIPGPTSTFNAYLMGVKGEDWLRKLLAQDLVVLGSGREEMEGLVRGRFSMAVGTQQADLEQFREEGLTRNIKPIDPDDPAGRRLTSGIANVTLINRAPHPNAAKVFINWLLSREGQTVWAETIRDNSRRLDVQGSAETAPKAGVVYEVEEREWSPLLQNSNRAMEIAKEILR